MDKKVNSRHRKSTSTTKMKVSKPSKMSPVQRKVQKQRHEQLETRLTANIPPQKRHFLRSSVQAGIQAIGEGLQKDAEIWKNCVTRATEKIQSINQAVAEPLNECLTFFKGTEAATCKILNEIEDTTAMMRESIRKDMIGQDKFLNFYESQLNHMISEENNAAKEMAEKLDSLMN